MADVVFGLVVFTACIVALAVHAVGCHCDTDPR